MGGQLDIRPPNKKIGGTYPPPASYMDEGHI